MEIFDFEAEVALCALYAPGIPGRPALRSRWPQVLRILRSRAPQEPPAKSLETAGLWEEARCCADAERDAWARDLCARAKLLSAACPSFPQRWLARAGSAGARGCVLPPPALWKSRHLPSGPFIAMIGTRSPSGFHASEVARLGREVHVAGCSLVSGCAAGIDRMAAQAYRAATKQVPRAYEYDARPGVIGVLPCGCAQAPPAVRWQCLLSACPPGEEFSVAKAMERNVMIYSMADAAIVIGPRLRAGGTWHGAVSALRSRLTRVFVLDEPQNPAVAALVALGAQPLAAGESLSVAMATPESLPQQSLWHALERRRVYAAPGHSANPCAA